MSQDRFDLFYLSDDQLFQLVDVLSQQYGIDLSRTDFADHMLQLFEDIPGFETVTDSDTQPIIDSLWSLYCDQQN